MSLRVRLLSLLLLAVLPLNVLTVYTYIEQRSEATRQAQQQALRLVRLAGADQQHITDQTRQLLAVLALLPSVREQDGFSCSLCLAAALEQSSIYQNLVATTASGDVLCSAVPLAAPTNMAALPAFHHALQTHGFSAGEYAPSRATRSPSICYAYPILGAAGEVRGMLGALIDLAWLGEFMDRAALPTGSTLKVVDDSGAILARYPDVDLWATNGSPAATVQPEPVLGEGFYEGVGADGVPRFYAFARFESIESGFEVHIGIPQAEALAEANRTLARNVSTLGAVILVALALAWAGGSALILRPVNVLLDVIRRFESGDLGARVGPVAGDGELGRVARALDHMAATVEAREAEREHTQQELRRYGARAEALRAIVGRLNAQLDLERVLDAVCQETARALGMPAASVGLCEANSDEQRLTTCCGLPGDSCAHIHGAALAALPLLKQGQVALVTDVAALPDATLFAAHDIQAFIAAPILHEGQLVGALCVFTQGGAQHFSGDEIGFLRAIADQAASAVANARLYESLKHEQQLRGDLLRDLISAQEDERKRIARELHDETAQGLSVLIVHLETLSMELANAGQAASRPVLRARAVAASVLDGIRRLIGDLRPSLLDDLGLVPAIAWYAGQRLQSLGVEVDLQCDLPDDCRLPPTMETALYRVAQEAISNIARHAGATKATIDLHVAGDMVVLAVEDNGCGFEPLSDSTQACTGRGLGLQGMRERARILGGQFWLSTTPGRGTSITVEVPVTPGEAVHAQDTDPAGR